MKSEMKKYDNINAVDAQFISDISRQHIPTNKRHIRLLTSFKPLRTGLSEKELSNRSSMAGSALNMANFCITRTLRLKHIYQSDGRR